MTGRVLVWVGHVWTERARLALEHYGDRITDVSIFGWSVSATGDLTLTFDPTLLDPYREKWPHIRFWGCFRNMDDPNHGPLFIFNALRSSPAARARLADEVQRMFEEYPWLHGVDIDMENGGNTQSAASELIFSAVADRAHSLNREVSCALPPLTAEGSVGGENWVRYAQLGQIVDHMAIMSYDFAWSGSAPGPVSPGFWMKTVYDWVVSQVDPSKVLLGIPLYSYNWFIHDYPWNIGRTYRGASGTYYAAWQRFTGYRAWDGTDSNPAGSGSHHRIGWLAFRDADSRSAWGFIDTYDWRDAHGWDAGTASGITAQTWDGKPYTVRYGRPSGTPLWSVADNSSSTAGARYTLTPRRVRATGGELVSPKAGFTLTAELLKRHPVAATIIDDNAGTPGQLEAIYNVASGSWSRWTTGTYHQYRGAGALDFAHDFTGDAVYLEIRGQFASYGWAGVTVRGITAEVNPSGTLRVRQGGTILATGTVSARPVGAAAGSGRFVLALRVREGSARAYFALVDTRELPLIAHVPVTPSGGAVGIESAATVWIDHVYLGDGWWYQPREAVEATIGSQSVLLGRMPRTGITWDSANRFRPLADVDEAETRSRGISQDWVYDHWQDAPLTPDAPAQVRIRAVDHDVWMGRVLAVDRDGAAIVFWSDAETVAYWRDRAHFDYGISGIALWTLGQEDLRTWERLAGGELPPETKRINA